MITIKKDLYIEITKGDADIFLNICEQMRIRLKDAISSASLGLAPNEFKKIEEFLRYTFNET